MVTALMIRPMEHPCVTQLCDNRDYLDHAVSFGTDMLYSASFIALGKGIAAIFAHESIALSLQGNRRVGKRILCGTFYIVGVIDGKLRSLTDKESTKYTLRYWEPEIITQDEIIEAWSNSLLCNM